MAGNSLTTLEDLGWLPYWDKEGHDPVQPGDEFGLLPSEEITIYWIAKPVQEEDGNWYANRIFLYEPLPTVVGGLYRTEIIRTDSTICGEDDSQTLQGKIEEFCFWEQDIGLAGMQNYQMNLTGMIGPDIGDKYTSIATAEADGLRYYYQFNTENILTQNFTGEGSVCIKTKAMETGSGKIADASILVPSSQITFEKMHFSEEFSMSIRYYLEKHEDFVLFNNPSALKISYDASNLVYRIDFRPYIGDEKIYYLEAPRTKVHEWYDMGVRYSDGVLYLSINGQSLEEFRPITTIGGAIRTVLDGRNIENFTIKAGSGAGIYYPTHQSSHYLYDTVSSHDDHESLDIPQAIHLNNFAFEFGGRENMMALLLDKENDIGAGMSIRTDYSLPDISVVDSVSDTRKISFPVYTYASSRRMLKWEIEEDLLADTIHTRGLNHTISSYSTDRPYTSFSLIPNVLTPGQPIELVMKVKGILVEQPPLFPKVSISPGTRIKVTKIKMTPSISENYVPDMAAINENYAVSARLNPSYSYRECKFYNPYNYELLIYLNGDSRVYNHLVQPGSTAHITGSRKGWEYSSGGSYDKFAPTSEFTIKKAGG